MSYKYQYFGQIWVYGEPVDMSEYDLFSEVHDPDSPVPYCEWELGKDPVTGEQNLACFSQWGTAIEQAKFLQYLINKKMMGNTFSGEILWMGEEPGDVGKITVGACGSVHIQKAQLVYGPMECLDSD